MIDTNSNESNVSVKEDFMFRLITAKTNRNMKFVGLFEIIYGAIACVLSIVGIGYGGIFIGFSITGTIVGILMIIAGVLLREAANCFEVYTISSTSTSLERGFKLQGKYFFIQKLFIIIGLIIFALIIIGNYIKS